LKIGLVTDSIEMGSPGLRRYSMRLAEEMLRLLPGGVTLVHRGPGTDPFYAGKPTLRIWNPRVPFAGKQVVFRQQTRNLGFDVLHDTYHFPPFLVPLPYARVMSIADLTPMLMDTHRLKNKLAHRLLLPALARRADHIVTISEHTRRDVIATLGIAPEKVSATPLAADEHLRPVADPERLNRARTAYRLPARYFLHVGTLEPRKNLTRLVEAFARTAASVGDVSLVVAGARGWGDEDLGAQAKRLAVETRVVFIGRVAEEDLAALYSGAVSLVYPSLYEGFGLPPLEAMQCGCPVITSNVSSLPEVVGNAAILVDPLSVEEIAAAMTEVASRPGLSAKMAVQGISQAARFTWSRCAELTLAAYDKALETRAATGVGQRLAA